MSSKVRRRCTASSQSPRVLSLLVSALLVLALAAMADPPPGPPPLAWPLRRNPLPLFPLPLLLAEVYARSALQPCLPRSHLPNQQILTYGVRATQSLQHCMGRACRRLPRAGRVGRERAVGRTAGRPDCGLRRLRWLQLLAYWAVVSFPKSGGHGTRQQSRSARGDLGVRGRARDFCFFPVRGFFWFARGPLCHYGGSR